MNFPISVLVRLLIALALSAAAALPSSAQQYTQQPPYVQLPADGVGSSTTGGGPIRLRQTPSSADDAPGMRSRNDRSRRSARQRQGDDARIDDNLRLRPEYQPSEFERYVQRLVDATPEAPVPLEPPTTTVRDGLIVDERRPGRVEIRRLGAELITDTPDDDPQEFNPLVPPDYLISPGDEIALTVWGSIDADLRLVVDRSGRISVPRVGSIMVSGTRYADLPTVISRRIAQTFKNFQLSVGLGQLRGVRVFVTGFVQRPGAYAMSSLSTIVQALVRAGGPAAAGSFRNVQLRRAGQAPVNLDLYDLLLKGDRSSDRPLQADDVIHVGAIGPQVAFIGSVNKPAVFELMTGETVADVLRMAGGFTAVADTSRVAVERLDERSTTRITQLELPQAGSVGLRNGDVLRAFSAVSVALPVQRQNKRVRVEGEVVRPGEYVLPPDSSIADAVRAAGGLTPAAYIFGTEFSRESVRQTQQENYERALRDLETDFARATTTQRVADANEAAAQQAKSSATQRLVERLRAVRPNGRIVLQIQPDNPVLPELALEDADRLYIPPRPTTVGVFGSVFNGGSYLYSGNRSYGDYLRLAGGPTRGADDGSVFVIRANGSVISARQSSNWLSVGDRFNGIAAEPGDTIFVPEEINKTTFVQGAKDWTQILYQFGIGLAGIAAVK